MELGICVGAGGKICPGIRLIILLAGIMAFTMLTLVMSVGAVPFTDLPDLPLELEHYAEKDAQIFISRGMAHFRRGSLELSTNDFDTAIRMDPKIEGKMWQRGLNLYYHERHTEAAAQFELDVALNPNDTEESIWHLLSVVRGEIRPVVK